MERSFRRRMADAFPVGPGSFNKNRTGWTAVACLPVPRISRPCRGASARPPARVHPPHRSSRMELVSRLVVRLTRPALRRRPFVRTACASPWPTVRRRWWSATGPAPPLVQPGRCRIQPRSIAGYRRILEPHSAREHPRTPRGPVAQPNSGSAPRIATAAPEAARRPTGSVVASRMSRVSPGTIA